MGKVSNNVMAEGFTVKNTFIEIDDGFFEGDGLDLLEGPSFGAKRQVSEPANAFGRQVSAVQPMRALQEEAGASGELPDLEELSSSSGLKLFDNEEEDKPDEDGTNEAARSQADHARFQTIGLHPPVSGASMAVQHGGNHNMLSQDFFQVPAEWCSIFTVMMRNLPNRYTQLMLLEEISEAGFAGTFDFLYLPIDPDTTANKGYAFINFVDPVHAWRFKGTYEGQQMKCFNSNKFVSVNPAALQGLEANYAHYSTARCSRGNPLARPLFFREPQQKFTPRNAARRGGHRRRVNVRSLVDEAVFERNDQFMQRDAWNPQQLQPKQYQQQQKKIAMDAQEPVLVGECRRFCPYCGGVTMPSYRFCKFCGASLEGLEALLGQ